MGLRTNIIGYHVNDEERCRTFVNNEEYLINSKDAKWLGYGMYFWDNESNADYWITQKKRKNPEIKKLAKVRCNIFTDKLLDLTDTKMLDTFNRLWEEYCKKGKCELSQPLGAKLDRIFDFFKTIDDMFKVIRVYGKYNKTPKNDFIEYMNNDKNKNSDSPTYDVKCIYSVRDKECIANRELVEVIENEKYKGN